MIDIKKRRIELDLTLEDIGKATGVGKSTVHKWESGDIENMRTDKISKLAKVLKLSINELLGWDEEPPQLSDADRRRAELYAQAKESDDPVLKGLIAAIDRMLGIDEQGSDDNK